MRLGKRQWGLVQECLEWYLQVLKQHVRGIHDVGITTGDVDQPRIFVLKTIHGVSSLAFERVQTGILLSAGARHPYSGPENSWGGFMYVTWSALKGYAEGGEGADRPFVQHGLDLDEFEQLFDYDLGSWSVVVIPEPGHPCVRWWSAAKGRWVSRGRPVRWSFCDQEPIRLGEGPNAPVLLEKAYAKPQDTNFGRHVVPPLTISHGVDVRSFQAILRCGGNLLWPSFAVGWTIPPSYGDVLFLADARVIPANMKPFQADWRIVLYPTDTWTETARELLALEKAISHELCGDWDATETNYTVQDGLVFARANGVLSEIAYHGSASYATFAGQGSDAWASAFSRRGYKRIRSMRDFWGTVEAMFRAHGPALRPEGQKASDIFFPSFYREPVRALVAQDPRAYHYEYLELKVHAPVRIPSLTAAVYPAKQARRVQRFLDAVGFTGWRIKTRYDGPPAKDASSMDRYRFSLEARFAIEEWASSPCDAKAIPGDIRRDWGSRYGALAPWHPKAFYYESSPKDLGVGWHHGYCPGGE